MASVGLSWLARSSATELTSCRSRCPGGIGGEWLSRREADTLLNLDESACKARGFDVETPSTLALLAKKLRNTYSALS